METLTTNSMTVIIILTLSWLSSQIYAYNSGLYAENAFQQTVLVEEISTAHRKELKEQILNLLGLDKRPRPPRDGDKNSAPHYMLDLYRTLELGWSIGGGFYGDDHDEEEQEEEEAAWVGARVAEKHLALPGMERDVGKADMIMSFVNLAHKFKEKLRHEGHRRIYFDMTEVPLDQQLLGAELRLYKFPTISNASVDVKLFRVTGDDTDREHSLKLVASMRVGNQESGWLEFNMTECAMDWAVFTHSNMGLHVRVTDLQGHDVSPKEAGLVTKRHPYDKQPFMVAFFRATQEVHLRRTRSTRKRDRTDVTYNDDPGYGWGYGSHSPYRGLSCQKRTLYVSFKELNWIEWIIAPEGYAAFYCQGECSFPLNVHMNATNHAIVQTLVHLMDPSSVPKPSCAPTKLSGISVLYFDNNSNVILKKYRNMVVKSCGCH